MLHGPRRRTCRSGVFHDGGCVEALTAGGAVVVNSPAPQLVLDDCFYVSGEIPRVTPYERGMPPAHLRRTEDGTDWEHDQWIIEAHAKSIDSFGVKASTPANSDESRPKYSEPLNQITDLAGVRIITCFPRTIGQVDQTLRKEFTILERIDKTDLLIREEKFGYQSLPYIISLQPNRLTLPEYARHAELKAEIQVRTILQHA